MVGRHRGPGRNHQCWLNWAATCLASAHIHVRLASGAYERALLERS